MSSNRIEIGRDAPENSTRLGSQIRAAEYVRMSTDHQRYSVDNQSNAIRSYADQRGMEIVRTYTDAGRSGLHISGRTGLQQLLADVRSGAADYSVILVYDISRWGRFQDSDEPAAYEYACRVMGVRVAYCAEEFENDGSIGSDIQKVAKRHMAAEFSRDLSIKVFAGQRHLIELGYRVGGAPGFGLRRQLIDENGLSKGQLAPLQRKSIQTDRVVLVPGPAKERTIVRRIYSDFVHNRLGETEIAGRLNKRGVLSDLGRAWTQYTIHKILTHEKYIGNNIWNQQSFKLSKRQVRNVPKLWVRVEGAFPAIVERPLFDAAQEIIRARSQPTQYRRSDEELLQVIRDLLKSKGRLSRLIIDNAPEAPHHNQYIRRFGSLRRAYELIGYSCDELCRNVETRRILRRLLPKVTAQILEGIERVGGKVAQRSSSFLSVNGEFSVSVRMAVCFERSDRSLEWKIRLDRSLLPDVTVVVRMSPRNVAVHDYLILPTKEINRDVIYVTDRNGIALDAYQFYSLDPLLEMAERVSLMGDLHKERILSRRKPSNAKRIIEIRRPRRSKAREAPANRGWPYWRVRACCNEIERKQSLIQNAEDTRNRLAFIVDAMRQLLSNAYFMSLLNKERLETLPIKLAVRMEQAKIKCSTACTQSLNAASSDQILNFAKLRQMKGLAPEQVALMKQETANLDRQFRLIGQSFGDDHLDLVVLVGYVRRLIANARITRHLAQRFSEMLAEFEQITGSDRAANPDYRRPLNS